jgi:hypothetical protein
LPLDHEGQICFLVEELDMAEEIARRLPDDQPMPPRPAQNLGARPD